MKNLVLCLMMVFVAACGTENICDCPEGICDCPECECPEDEKLDFFVEHYSVCLQTCLLAVPLYHDCGIETVTLDGCVNQFWDSGMSNNDCHMTLSCYQVIRDRDSCEWSRGTDFYIRTFPDGCNI